MRKTVDVFENLSLTLVASAFLRSELAPYGTSSPVERAFVERLLAEIDLWIRADDAPILRTGEFRTTYGLAPLDSLHVAAAERSGVARFLILERIATPSSRTTSRFATWA